MLDRIKDAARQAKAEKQLQNLLKEAGIEADARITLRVEEGGLKATVILSPDTSLEEDQAKQLEVKMADLENIKTATLVRTAHHKGGQAPSPAPRQGHDNPLSLPGLQKKPSEKTPEKIRPGGAACVIAVASGKGGVGKSTVAARLALALAARGDQVGLLDLDIYGPSLPTMFDLEGVKPKVEEGELIPLKAGPLSLMSIGFLVKEENALAWRGLMVMGAARQLLAEVRWPPLDYLIIDTPPGTGDAHITLMQRTVIDGAVIVTTPSPLALADVRRGATLFRKMKTPILGLVENMDALPDGTRPFGEGLGDEHLAELQLSKLVSIPLDPKYGPLLGRTPDLPTQGPFTELVQKIDHQLEQLDLQRKPL